MRRIYKIVMICMPALGRRWEGGVIYCVYPFGSPYLLLYSLLSKTLKVLYHCHSFSLFLFHCTGRVCLLCASTTSWRFGGRARGRAVQAVQAGQAAQSTRAAQSAEKEIGHINQAPVAAAQAAGAAAAAAAMAMATRGRRGFSGGAGEGVEGALGLG